MSSLTIFLVTMGLIGFAFLCIIGLGVWMMVTAPKGPPIYRKRYHL